jgi:hypothetical protein
MIVMTGTTYLFSVARDSIPQGFYLQEWIQPETGKIILKETIRHTVGRLKLIIPTYMIDIALRLICQESEKK